MFMNRPLISYLLPAMFLAFPACKDQVPPSPAVQVQASALPKIKVTEGKKMLFTHASGGGTFTTIDELAKVPKLRRGWVRVVDLTIKAGRRMDHELVYVADLRSPGKDGAFPYVVMSRAAFESAALGRAGQGATDPPPAKGGAGPSTGQVVLYSTSWCGACKSARQYLTGAGVPFVEKDIEKDQAAAQELLAKAKAAGVSPSGVPVLDVGGTLVQGFDQSRIEALLEDMKPAEPKKSKKQ